MTALDRLDAIRERARKATVSESNRGYLMPVATSALSFMENDAPALEFALRKVLELHARAHAVFSWRNGIRYELPCETCDGKAGIHECGCWADSDIEYVCAECHRLGSGSKGVYDYAYPCQTVSAIEEALG